MINFFKNSRAFTLIEIMIVIAVVAIIAAIAYPNYTKHVRESRRSDGQASLLKIALEQERYRSSNPQYASSLTALGYSSATPNSSDSWYQLSVTSASATAFIVVATAQGAQSDDTDCSTLELTQNGPDTSTAQKAECWGK